MDSSKQELFVKELLKIAARIAYPKRGSKDDGYCVQQYADEIQALFEKYEIDHTEIED